jgi:hypothetical protein
LKIEVLTMLNTTSMSIEAANMGTLRSGATAPIAADAMTTTRIEWF